MKTKFGFHTFLAFILAVSVSAQTPSPTPGGAKTPQQNSVPIASVSTKETHVLAIGTDGTLWAWGRNFLGFLGDGTKEDRLTPVQIGTDNNWASASAGYIHSMAIKTDGTLWAWGNNYNVMLGDDTREPRMTPIQIGTDTNWKTVSAGWYHNLAIKTDGTLWAWGYDELGDIAVLHGSPKRVLAPYQIGTGKNWAAVAAGHYFSLAVKTDGTLWGFGHIKTVARNVREVTVFKYAAPTQIGTARNWSNVWTNLNHVIAMRTDGTLWGLGGNDSGQLGINAKDDYKLSLVQAGTDKDWATVAVGASHTMAIKTDGTLWGWGKNVYGELGNNAEWSERNPAPIRIGSGSNWKAVTAGYSFTAALTTDGVLWTWGKNEHGYLGDGTKKDRKAPLAIAFMPTGKTATTATSQSKPASPALSVQTGTFIDTRDQQPYRWVKIGSLTWMAENLKYVPPMVDYSTGSMVNSLMGGENRNLALYGRLYTYEAAKKACPPGWRLPTRSDWENLARTVGGIKKITEADSDTKDEIFHWEGAGKALKSNTGWRSWFGESGNGPNDLKFSAMPGGQYVPQIGDTYPEYEGNWWTDADSLRKTYAYGVLIGHTTDKLYEIVVPRARGLSVRAVRDNAPVEAPPLGDRSNLVLTAFHVDKTTISRNEEYTVHFRFKNMMSAGRSFNVYARAVFLDKNGKIASSFGGAVVDGLLAGTEDISKSIEIIPAFLRHLEPGQYQIRISIEYYDNGVETIRPITQALPDVPTSISVTVSNEAVKIRSGER